MTHHTCRSSFVYRAQKGPHTHLSRYLSCNLCFDIANTNPTNGNPTLSSEFLLGLVLVKQIRAFSGRQAYLCFDIEIAPGQPPTQHTANEAPSPNVANIFRQKDPKRRPNRPVLNSQQFWHFIMWNTVVCFKIGSVLTKTKRIQSKNLTKKQRTFIVDDK